MLRGWCHRESSGSLALCDGECDNCKRDIELEGVIDFSDHSKALISIIENAKKE